MHCLPFIKASSAGLEHQVPQKFPSGHRLQDNLESPQLLWKWKWKSLSCVQLFVTLWTIESMEFSRAEYWSISLLQWIFLTQELNRGLLHCRWILYQLSYQASPHNFHFPPNLFVEHVLGASHVHRSCIGYLMVKCGLSPQDRRHSFLVALAGEIQPQATAPPSIQHHCDTAPSPSERTSDSSNDLQPPLKDILYLLIQSLPPGTTLLFCSHL